MNDEALWDSLEAPFKAEDGEQPRDELGRFVKAEPVPEGVVPPTESAPAPEAEAAEVVSEEATTVSETETPAPETKRPLATQFTVYDPEGPVEVPEVEVEFKAHGEIRRMPLDKVVRLAQSGFYNEQLQSEVRETRGKVADIESRATEAEQRAERLATLNRQLLESEDAYLQYRDQYQRMNSPEERARRLETELHRERAIRQQEQWQQQAQSFLQGDLEPKVSALLKQYPSVTETEAVGWLAPQLKSIEVQGIVPPQRYGDVRRLVDSDLAEWMSQVHSHRSETTKAAEAARTLTLRKAQAETTKAKRELTKVASPAKAPGAVTAPPPSDKPNPKLSAKEEAAAMWKRLGLADAEE